MSWYSRLNASKQLGVAAGNILLRSQSAVCPFRLSYQFSTIRKIGSRSLITVSDDDDHLMKKHAVDIFEKAVKSVLPDSMVRRAIQVNEDKLFVGGNTYDLNHNVHIIAFGKAVSGMVRAAEQILHKHIQGGVASVPYGIQDTFKKLGKTELLPLPDSKVVLMEGAKNNYPDDDAHAAAMSIYNLCDSLKEGDIALCLISGGGSTLLPAPLPPISMSDLTTLTKMMSLAGASIQELNIVRKHVERLKGGGLAAVAAPAKVIALILSDVIGDPLGFIASGPTVPDFTTPRQCLDLLSVLGIKEKVPSSVVQVLRQQEVEHIKQRQLRSTTGPRPLHECPNAYSLVVGSNTIAASKAAEHADSLGYVTYVLTTEIDGEARVTGMIYAKIADFICRSMGNKAGRDMSHLIQDELGLIKHGVSKKVINDLRCLADDAVNRGKPLCIIGAGECVVNVKGPGVGGRNQELALSAAIHMHHRMHTDELIKKNFYVGFLSGATDGQDGPCDAAGAMVHPEIVEQATDQHLNAQEYMDNNDSYHFFAKLNAGHNHLKTGLTGTNVMDLQILLIHPHLWD